MKVVRLLRAGAESVWKAYAAEMKAGGVEAETVAKGWMDGLIECSYLNFDYWVDDLNPNPDL